MKRYIRANYRRDHKDKLHHVKISDLNPGEYVYFVNGMNDVAICEFIEYDTDIDRDGRKRYELIGKVIQPLNERYRIGQITNMVCYSESVEVYEEEKMKVYSAKFYNYRLKEDDYVDRLSIPASEVKGQVLKNVVDKDRELFQYLIDNKVITTLATNSNLRNNPYYDLEDKFIRLVSEDRGKRTYSVPYPGSGRFGEGDIYEKQITFYDDGKIKFESGRVVDPDKLSPSTLKSYFWKSSW